MIRPLASIHRPALSALLLAALTPGCVSEVTSSSTTHCDSRGKSYEIGESFPAPDGCNTCTCQSDGSAACTEMGCVTGCSWQGNQYAPGESFDSGDGCNSCTCDPSGEVSCTLIDCEPPPCTYQGQVYYPGQSFPAPDGCNTCSCDYDGQVACTGLDCQQLECKYAGKTYSPGESFPAIDGCNTCTCYAQGVGCSDVACACDPAKEWWHEYVSTDPAQCQVIDYACPPNTTGFDSACGCGCEQSKACPEWFDCMPPNPCNQAAIAQCPYSGVAY